jgi:aryl-alcohol dehydrogenase-like predicted oxidoreductase
LSRLSGSETTLGEWLRGRKNRAELVIATNVGFNRAAIGPIVTC